ncbi:MAG: protein kinase [Myxococcaceae bacterium]|nr:protein kinase [Myxococcaceae bacterium]
MVCPLCQREHDEAAGCPAPSAPLPRHGGVSAAGYQLVRELGRGSAGIVYLAEHGATGLPVAIKLLPPELVTDPAQARRFAIEARCTNRIVHDAVVNVFDFNDEDADGPWLVMEYLQGVTLGEVATRGPGLPEALALLEQLASVLDAAHAVGIVHGGLVPGKVMVVDGNGRGRQVKVLPFGVDAGAVDPADVPFARLGEPDWRAPEQTRGAPAHRHADLYSLGCLAYLLMTGRPPFAALSPDALARAHAEVIPEAPHRVKRSLAPAVSEALLRALEKDPARRYASASQFVEALRDAFVQPFVQPPSNRPRAAGPGAGGLAEGFVVRDSPAPVASQAAAGVGRPVSGGAGGLAEGFVVRDSPALVPGQAAAGMGRPGSAPVSGGAGGLAEGIVVRDSPAPASGEGRPQRPSGVTGGPSVVREEPVRPSQVVAPVASSPSPVPGGASPAGLVLRVTVSDASGRSLGQFACASVTRQGGVVCSDTVRPPLLETVRLVFDDLDSLSCDARVVQHISVEQAALWKMSPGFSVQFDGLSPEQRAQIEAGHAGVLGPETPSQVLRRPDDTVANDVLRRFSAEAAKDAYSLLGLSKASPFDAIRDRLREARRALEGLRHRPLSVAQLEALEAARGRLELLGGQVSEPLDRLEYDAGRGNFEGVARCIGAGVPIAEVEAARARFLEAHPGLDTKSRERLNEGQRLEAAGEKRRALEVYSAALISDPLHVGLQQRYWAVRRQLG